MHTTKKKSGHYSDADYVEGVFNHDPEMERELYTLCKKYYENNFHKPDINDEDKKDIFQSSLLALWENIYDGRLYVENRVLMGKDGEPFTSTLTTYFYSIVHNKYLEWLRKKPIAIPLDPMKGGKTGSIIDEDSVGNFIYDDKTVRRLAVVANRISHIAKQCNRILTLFYYEEKDYEEIMLLMPTFTSKDALKTAKYKCLKRLRDSVTGTYC